MIVHAWGIRQLNPDLATTNCTKPAESVRRPPTYLLLYVMVDPSDVTELLWCLRSSNSTADNHFVQEGLQIAAQNCFKVGYTDRHCEGRSSETISEEVKWSPNDLFSECHRKFVSNCCVMFNLHPEDCSKLYKKMFRCAEEGSARVVPPHLEGFLALEACSELREAFNANDVPFQTARSCLINIRRPFTSTKFSFGECPNLEFVSTLENFLIDCWKSAIEEMQKETQKYPEKGDQDPQHEKLDFLKVEEKRDTILFSLNGPSSTDDSVDTLAKIVLQNAEKSAEKIYVIALKENRDEIVSLMQKLENCLKDICYEEVLVFGRLYFSHRIARLDLVLHAFDMSIECWNQSEDLPVFGDDLKVFVEALMEQHIGYYILVELARRRFCRLESANKKDPKESAAKTASTYEHDLLGDMKLEIPKFEDYHEKYGILPSSLSGTAHDDELNYGELERRRDELKELHKDQALKEETKLSELLCMFVELKSLVDVEYRLQHYILHFIKLVHLSEEQIAGDYQRASYFMTDAHMNFAEPLVRMKLLDHVTCALGMVRDFFSVEDDGILCEPSHPDGVDPFPYHFFKNKIKCSNHLTKRRKNNEYPEPRGSDFITLMWYALKMIRARQKNDEKALHDMYENIAPIYVYGLQWIDNIFQALDHLSPKVLNAFKNLIKRNVFRAVAGIIHAVPLETLEMKILVITLEYVLRFIEPALSHSNYHINHTVGALEIFDPFLKAAEKLLCSMEDWNAYEEQDKPKQGEKNYLEKMKKLENEILQMRERIQFAVYNVGANNLVYQSFETSFKRRLTNEALEGLRRIASFNNDHFLPNVHKIVAIVRFLKTAVADKTNETWISPDGRVRKRLFQKAKTDVETYAAGIISICNKTSLCLETEGTSDFSIFGFQQKNDSSCSFLIQLVTSSLRSIEDLFQSDPELMCRLLNRKFFESVDRVIAYEAPACVRSSVDSMLTVFRHIAESIVRSNSIIDLNRQFRHIDVDKSGDISREEFRNALGKPPFMLKKLSSAAVRELMSAFDSNGDDKVDYGEFVQFVFNNEKVFTGADENPEERGVLKSEMKENSVDREICNVLRVVSGRTRNLYIANQELLFLIGNCACKILCEQTRWRFALSIDKWAITVNCLRILRTCLDPSGGSMFKDVFNAQQRILDNCFRDQSLREGLLSVITQVSTKCWKMEYQRRHVLPVNFCRSSGPLFSCESEDEKLLLESMTESGLNVLLRILQSRVPHGTGQYEETRVARLKVAFFSQLVIAEGVDSMHALLNMRNWNHVVAIASFIGYDQRRHTKLPMLATKIVGKLSELMSKTRLPPYFYDIDDRDLEFSDQFKGSSHSSLIVLFDRDKDTFKDIISRCLEEEDAEEIQAELISLLMTLVECQPAAAGLFLTDDSLVNLLVKLLSELCEKGIYSRTFSRLLGLISALRHSQSKGRYRDLSKDIAERYMQGIEKYWKCITSPLFSSPLSPGSDPVTFNEEYCNWLDSCAFSFELLALEMSTGNSSNIRQFVEKMQEINGDGKTTLEEWFQKYSEFSFDEAKVQELKHEALQLGINLEAYEVEESKQLGSREYSGMLYLYDYEKLEGALRHFGIHTKKIDVDKFLKLVEEVNINSSRSDSELSCFKRFSHFVQAYCLSNPRTLTRRLSITPGGQGGENGTFVGAKTSLKMLEGLSERFESEKTGCGFGKSAYALELSDFFLTMVFHRLYDYDDDGTVKRRNAEQNEDLDTMELLEKVTNFMQRVFGQENEGFSLSLPLILSALLLYKNMGTNNTLEQPSMANKLLANASMSILRLSATPSKSFSVNKILFEKIGACLHAISDAPTRNRFERDDTLSSSRRAPSGPLTRDNGELCESFLIRACCTLFDSIFSGFARRPKTKNHNQQFYDALKTFEKNNTLTQLFDILWSSFSSKFAPGTRSFGFHREIGARALGVLKVFRSLAHEESAAIKLLNMGIIDRILSSSMFESLDSLPRPSPGNIAPDIQIQRLDYENFVRGYVMGINGPDRSQVHQSWCVAVDLMTEILRSAKVGKNQGAIERCSKQILHCITRYEKTFLWAIEPFGRGSKEERFTLAALEEMKSSTLLLYELVQIKAVAQRWSIAFPDQFRSLMRGVVRSVQALSFLCKSGQSTVFKSHMRQNTLYVTEAEQSTFRRCSRRKLRIAGRALEDSPNAVDRLKKKIRLRLDPNEEKSIRVVVWKLGEENELLSVETLGSSLVDELFNFFDRGGIEDGPTDKKINLPEFKQTLEEVVQKNSLPESLKHTKHIFDELHALIDKKDVESIFKEFDIDYSEDEKEIDFNEFRQGLTSLRLDAVKIHFDSNDQDPIKVFHQHFDDVDRNLIVHDQLHLRGKTGLRGDKNSNSRIVDLLRYVTKTGGKISNVHSICVPIVEGDERNPGKPVGVLQVLSEQPLTESSIQNEGVGERGNSVDLFLLRMADKISEQWKLSSGDSIKFYKNGKLCNAEVVYIHNTMNEYHYDIRMENEFYRRIQNKACEILRASMLLLAEDCITPRSVEVERGLIDTIGAMSIFEFAKGETSLERDADGHYLYQPTIDHLFRVAQFCLYHLVQWDIDEDTIEHTNMSQLLDQSLYLIWNNASRAINLYKKFEMRGKSSENYSVTKKNFQNAKEDYRIKITRLMGKLCRYQKKLDDKLNQAKQSQVGYWTGVFDEMTCLLSSL